MNPSGDTIVAIATPAGRGGIGIVRLSGPLVGAIAEAMAGGLPPPREARFRRFVDGEGQAIDQGILLYFPAPRSFTGEDVLEMQGHGGPVVLDLLVERAIALGARTAKPGEFSERAFFNGKIDLSQAEAIADLIDSASREAARGAMRSLQGEFSRRVGEVAEALTRLRTLLEASIDFPEDEIDILAEGEIGRKLDGLDAQLAGVLAGAAQGALLREGMKIVLAGKPNSGKSTLMNLLAGKETAIVTPHEGTTRDLVRETIHLEGMPLHLVDTAGLRRSEDEAEREGIRRAWREIEDADQVLLLVDASRSQETDPGRIFPDFVERLSGLTNLVVIRNKIDLLKTPLRPPPADARCAVMDLSARRGDGLPELLDHLKRVADYHPGQEGRFTARRRHLEALGRTSTFLKRAREVSAHSGEVELVAEELRLAQRALAEITGAVTTEELLGRIFSEFCIGK